MTDSWYAVTNTASPDAAETARRERVLGAWKDAPFRNLEVLEFILITAKEDVIEYAPAEGADAFIEGLGPPLERYPHLAEMANEMVRGRDYAYGSEFGYGLELILDQLQARLDAS